MPRPKRLDIAGQIYRVSNRANARLQIFDQKQKWDQAPFSLKVWCILFCLAPLLRRLRLFRTSIKIEQLKNKRL